MSGYLTLLRGLWIFKWPILIAVVSLTGAFWAHGVNEAHKATKAAQATCQADKLADENEAFKRTLQIKRKQDEIRRAPRSPDAARRRLLARTF